MTPAVFIKRRKDQLYPEGKPPYREAAFIVSKQEWALLLAWSLFSRRRFSFLLLLGAAERQQMRNQLGATLHTKLDENVAQVAFRCLLTDK